MRQQPRRAKAAITRKPAVRRTAKKAAQEISPDEARQLEQISRRYEESERAWQRMTAAPEGDEPWTNVEESLLSRAAREHDADRRWKYFSK